MNTKNRVIPHLCLSIFIVKLNEIKRTNQVLLERLLDISKGKNVSVGRHNEISPGVATAPRSLNYLNKRKEADRIDRENQKIMERIIKQGPTYQSRKLELEYQETTLRFKKMKQKSMAISVEKMLEKKKEMMKDIRSNYLPLISQSTKNQDDVSITELLGSRNVGYTQSTQSSDQMRAYKPRVLSELGMNSQKKRLNGNYSNLVGEGYSNHDSRFILAESGKMHDPTNEQIDEEEDEMKETSNLMGNSSSNIASDRKKADPQQLKPKVNNLIPKPLPSVKPISISKSGVISGSQN